MNNIKTFIKRHYLLIIFSIVVAVVAHGYFIYKQINYGHLMVGTGDQTYQMILFKDYLYKQFSEGNFFYSFTFNGGGNFFTNLSYYYSTSMVYYLTAFITYLLEGIGILSNIGTSYWANSIIVISVLRSILILYFTTKLIEYFTVKRPIAFFGATFYAVSVIYFRHVIFWEFFADAMIWLPILILGAEKIINNESGTIFSIGVFLAMFNNGYFAYKSFLFLIVYIVIRALVKLNKNEISIIKQIQRYFIYGIIGTFLALPGFVPFVMGYLNTSRLSPEFDIALTNFQSIHLPGFLFFDNTFIIPVIFMLFALTFFLYKNKKFRLFSFLSIVLIILRYNPTIASITNGLSYPQYRWMYILNLFIAIAIGIGLQFIYDNRTNIKMRNSLLISSILTVAIYIGIYVFSIDVIDYSFTRAIPILAVIQIVLFLAYTYWSKIHLNVLVSISIFLSIFAVYVGNRQLYHDSGLRREDFFVERFDDKNSKYQQAVDFIEKDTDDFYRIDIYDGSNYSLPFEVSSFNLYSSFQNKNQQYFERDFQVLSDRDSNGELSGLGKRKILNSLFQVDYVVAPENRTFRVPVGYEVVETFEDLNIYKNDRSLEFIHPVREIYDQKDFSNETFKDELILNGVITEDIERNRIMKNNQSLINEVPYNVDYQNVQHEEDVIQASEENQLTIDFENYDFDSGSIMLEYTLEPLNRYGEHEYSVNDYRIQLNGTQLPYSEQRFRNRIPIHDTSEIAFSFESDTEYHFKIHNLHYVSEAALQDREVIGNSFNYNYDIEDGSIRITYDNIEDYPVMVLPIYNEPGWDLLVNGEETELLTVNSGMIGFEIPSNEVEIELVFNQPFLKETIILSGIALVVLIFTEKKQLLKKDK